MTRRRALSPWVSVAGRAARCAAVLLAIAAMAACATRSTTRPSSAGGRPEKGNASWYGPKFHGRTTANGERYNMMDLTAAHKTLPFGTFVRVTNRSNDRSVVVRINDRGPFVHGRIIDLSYAAAKAIGASTSGVISVEVRVIDRARGASIHAAQKRLIEEIGVRAWTDRDYRRLEEWAGQPV